MEIDLHPALSSIQRIITRELGSESAAAVFADIAVREAGDDASATDPVRWVWSEAWKRLAALSPDAFAVPPAGIDHISGYQLAFLYGLRREPNSVCRVALSPHEEQELAHGRALLKSWSGLRGFRRPGLHYQWDSGSVALSGACALESYADVGGSSFDAYKKLRRVALYPLSSLDGARDDPHPAASLAAALLHEETHAALNVASGRAPTHLRPLTRAVDEAAAMLTDATIYLALADDEAPTRKRALDYLVSAPHMVANQRRDALVLLEALPEQLNAASWTKEALQLVVAMASSSDEVAARTLLNRVTHRRWSERRWRSELGLDAYWR